MQLCIVLKCFLSCYIFRVINLIQSLFFSFLESETINLFGAWNKVSFRTKTMIMNRVCLQCISSNYFTNTFYHIMCWIRLRMHHEKQFLSWNGKQCMKRVCHWEDQCRPQQNVFLGKTKRAVSLRTIHKCIMYHCKELVWAWRPSCKITTALNKITKKYS